MNAMRLHNPKTLPHNADILFMFVPVMGGLTARLWLRA